jgi:hypothetical protein
MRREREAAQTSMPEPPRPPPPPYEASRQMARQFMERQTAACRNGRAARGHARLHHRPWREMAHHTADQAERYRGYTELITAALALIREAEAEASPQREMELEAG